MKKLLIILAILIGYTAHAQFDSLFNKLLEDKIAGKLDSVIVKAATSASATSFNIDTITVASGKVLVYQIILKGISLTGMGYGIKSVIVSNNNGLYTIFGRDVLAYGGTNDLISTKVAWSISLVNNMVIVKIFPNTGLINWTTRRFE